MSARIVEAACVAVPLLGTRLDEDALVADPVLAAVLRGSLAELVRAARA